MRIQYDTTIDEIIDVSVRMMKRSKVSRSWLRQGALLTALIGSGSAAIGCLVITYFLGLPLPVGFSVSGVAAVISAFYSWYRHGDVVRERLRKFCAEQYGDRERIPFELELREEGIWYRQMGVQNLVEWSNVEEIVQNDNAIEIYNYGGGAVFIRKRAFSTADEQQQFMEVAQQHLIASRTSSNWLRSG